MMPTLFKQILYVMMATLLGRIVYVMMASLLGQIIINGDSVRANYLRYGEDSVGFKYLNMPIIFCLRFDRDLVGAKYLTSTRWTYDPWDTGDCFWQFIAPFDCL